MNRTKIEWCDYTINPVKGLCPMHCKNLEGFEYCYAAGERGLYKRFKWNPEIRYEPIIMTDPFCYGKPSKIFVGSTMELFGDWVKPAWLDHIFEFCQRETNKRHTFIFLTKQPQNLVKWSPFPENCWVGISATNNYDFINGVGMLGLTKSKVKFVSFEPLLSWDDFTSEIALKYIPLVNWLIIGQCTPISAKTSPRIEWIEEIIESADKAKIPIFIKNNLHPLLHSYHLTSLFRQELPK